MHFCQAVRQVLLHEGGFNEVKHDPGGATNWGVSLRWLRSLEDRDQDGWIDGDVNRDGVVDVYDVRGMTREQAIGLYQSYWWDEFHYGELMAYQTAAKTFDMAVNMGAGQAHKLVQRAANRFGAGLVVDGVLGPMSRQKLNAVNDVYGLVHAICDEQEGFYRRLVEARQERAVFLKGWLNRARWVPSGTHHGG